MGRKRGTPIDESTFEGRLQSAVVGAPYSAQAIAEACGRQSAQSIYDWWKPDVSGSPNPHQLAVIASMTGRSLDWIVRGIEEDAAEPDFVISMRAVADGLSSTTRRQLVKFAQVMLEEERAAAGDMTGFTEEERDVVLAAPAGDRGVVADTIRRLHAQQSPRTKRGRAAAEGDRRALQGRS